MTGMSVRIALERPPFQDEIVPTHAAVETLSEGAADFTEGPAAGPDGRIYFSDRESRVFAYDLNDTGTVGGRHLLVDLGDLGHPDGMTVDVEGFLSVAVASRPARIAMPAVVTNVEFGRGADGNLLYVAAGSGLYSIRLARRGFRWPDRSAAASI
jgi:sugar lactone lactonase YvrE